MGNTLVAVQGIHHITCIAGDPQENFDFYVGVLGMRLVKRTVHQNLHNTYHLFYGDGAGTSGTALTFFPMPHMGPMIPGAGFATEIALVIPVGAAAYWQDRLRENGSSLSSPEDRFGQRAWRFTDPHGLQLALVEANDVEDEFVPWEASPVPAAYQIRCVHSVRGTVNQLDQTAGLFTEAMGFTYQSTDNGWHRYALSHGRSGQMLDLQESPELPRGTEGVGAVNHVAWGVADIEVLGAVRRQVMRTGIPTTRPIDRYWFDSVYFHEPGGMFLELATQGPGYTLDEEVAHLGEKLTLPPWIEPHRAVIEAELPPLTLQWAHGLDDK